MHSMPLRRVCRQGRGAMDGCSWLSFLWCFNTAFNKGLGVWPQMSVKERIQCVEKFTTGLKARREEIANILMWEICKNKADAFKEVDRTIDYISDTIKELKKEENANAHFFHDGGVLAQTRRVPLGVALCLGPFNYPLNECMQTLFPALLMGNCCVLKVRMRKMLHCMITYAPDTRCQTPRTGCMCHMPTLELYQSCFPPGVVNVIHGSGRNTLPPLMEQVGIYLSVCDAGLNLPFFFVL